MADANILKNAITRVESQICQMEVERGELLDLIDSELRSKRYMQFGIRDEIIKLINQNYDGPLNGLRLERADLWEAYEKTEGKI